MNTTWFDWITRHDITASGSEEKHIFVQWSSNVVFHCTHFKFIIKEEKKKKNDKNNKIYLDVFSNSC